MFRHVGLVAMRVLCAPASTPPIFNPRFQRFDNVSSPFDSLPNFGFNGCFPYIRCSPMSYKKSSSFIKIYEKPRKPQNIRNYAKQFYAVARGYSKS